MNPTKQTEVELANSIIDELLAEERAAAVRRYKRIAAIEQRAHKRLESLYLPLIRKLVAEGQHDAAQALMREMPDCVAKVFAMDALRQRQDY